VDATPLATPEPLPPRSLWRHADFNLLWAGQTVSEVGTAISQLALPTLAVLRFQAGPLAVGLLVACLRLPFPFMALPVGAVVDRFSRRQLAIAADVGLAATVAAIPVLDARGLLQLWTLDLLALLIGACSVVFDVALLAFIPSLVGNRLLPTAMARFEVTFGTASVVGPGLGGILVQAFGAARAIVGDAVSYLVSLACILRLRARETAPATTDTVGIGRSMAEGLRFVFGDPVLRSLVVFVGLLIVGSHAVEGIDVLFAYRSLHLSPGQLGGALMALGAGELVGAVILVRVMRPLGPGRSIAISGALCGGVTAFMPLGLVAPPLLVLVAVFLTSGLFSAVENIGQVTLRTLLTEDRMRGRMNAIFRTVFWGAWPVGSILGGAVASAVGTAQTIIGASLFAAVASLAMLLSPAGRVIRMPDAEAG
jgi:MFS family permease